MLSPQDARQKNKNKFTDSNKDLIVLSDENKVDLLNRTFNKQEIKKVAAREKYFTSQISTLQGPSQGLDCVKTREQK